MRDRRPTFAGIAACCAIAAAGCAPGPRAPRVDERNLRTPEEGAKSLDMQGRSAAAAAASVARGDGLALDTRTGLAIGDLQRLLQVNKASMLILVLDACFSGGGAHSFSRIALDARQAQQSEAELDALKDTAVGRAVLTATAPNQPAL